MRERVAARPPDRRGGHARRRRRAPAAAPSPRPSPARGRPTRRTARRTGRRPRQAVDHRARDPPIRQDSTSACASPPSERSCALVSSPSAAAATRSSAEALLGGEVDRGRAPAEVPVHDVRPLGAAELLAGLAEQVDDVAVAGEARPHAARDVVDHAEHADHRRGEDRPVAGLVVEAHVAAGDRDAELARSRRRARARPRGTAT